MKELKKANFELTKAKYLASKGAVSYSAKITLIDDDGEKYVRIRSEEIPCEPHSDLTEAFQKLKPMLCSFHGLKDAKILATDKRFKASAKQIEMFEGYQTEKNKTLVNVTGVSLTGSEENKGCIITGTYDGQSINCRNTKFSGDAQGFESQMEDICTIIEEEIFELAVNNKLTPFTAFTDETNTNTLDKEIEGIEGVFPSDKNDIEAGEPIDKKMVIA